MDMPGFLFSCVVQDAGIVEANLNQAGSAQRAFGQEPIAEEGKRDTRWAPNELRSVVMRS
jgi:hypothetical protein